MQSFIKESVLVNFLNIFDNYLFFINIPGGKNNIIAFPSTSEMPADINTLSENIKIM
jgi:hypothetical protein